MYNSDQLKKNYSKYTKYLRSTYKVYTKYKMVFKRTSCGHYFISDRGVVISASSCRIIKMNGVQDGTPYVYLNERLNITGGGIQRRKLKKDIREMYISLFGEESWPLAFKLIKRHQYKEPFYASYYASNRLADVVYSEREMKDIKRFHPSKRWSPMESKQIRVNALFKRDERATYLLNKRMVKRRAFEDFLISNAGAFNFTDPTKKSIISAGIVPSSNDSKSSTLTKKRKRYYEQHELECSFKITPDIVCREDMLLENATHSIGDVDDSTESCTDVDESVTDNLFFDSPTLSDAEIQNILAKSSDFIDDPITVEDLFAGLSYECESSLVEFYNHTYVCQV